jgi:hypothetical protein
VWYLGARAFTFSMKAACSFSSSFGGDVVRGYRDADFKEEFLLTRGRADAKHAHGRGGDVVKLMRGVGRDLECVAGAGGQLFSAEDCLHLAFEQDECFLEVVAMGRWAASRRNVHVDDAEAACGVFTGHGDGVGVTDEADVGKVVRLGDGEMALGIVGRDCGRGCGHLFSCCAGPVCIQFFASAINLN